MTPEEHGPMRGAERAGARDLAAFVPVDVARRLFALDPDLRGPVLLQGQAAVLFSDITGFTALADRLDAARGTEGTEALTGLLDAQFGRWSVLVRRFGGEVVRFAGDALLAVFWSDGPSVDALSAATASAAACALAIQESTKDQGIPLTCRVRIGAGPTCVARLGGYLGRWETLLCGDAPRQLFRPEPHLLAGQAGASVEAWDLCRAWIQGRQSGDGAWLLSQARRGITLPAVRPVAETSDDLRSCAPLIPRHVLHHFELDGAAFLAEMRSVTVMFAGLPDLDPTREGGIGQAQRAVEGIQELLRTNGGALDKLVVDDKGVSLLAAFGLPPSPSENRGVAGLTTAIELEESLDRLGLRCSIGLASGRVFCGPVGGSLRREYTIIGTAVNRAARLMTLAGNTVSCDRETQALAEGFVAFESLGPHRLRGLDEPVLVFRPHAQDARTTTSSIPRVDRIAGRRDEMALLHGALEAPSGEPRARFVIAGPAGIGKSTVVGAFLSQAAADGHRTALVAASPAQRNTAFAAWRPWFEELLGIDAQAGAEAGVAALEARPWSPEERPLLPLLEPLLRLGLGDNDYTRQLSGTNRSAVAQDLMLGLIGSQLGQEGALLVLEDLQWLDAPSLQIAVALARRTPSLLVLGTFRGRADEAMGLLGEFVAQARVVELQGLDAAGVHVLVQQELGVEPDLAVSRWLCTRTGGNPLFCQELARTLVEQGVLHPSGSRSPDPEVLDNLTLPIRIEDAIVGRLDRLTAVQQLVVKTASAAGQEFDWRLLRAALPLERDEDGLREDIRAVVKAGLLAPVGSGDGDAWAFTHGVCLDVAYRTMVGPQRRAIHRAVALHLETRQPDDPRRDRALLAHHWGRAAELRRAFDAYDEAVDEAARDGLQRQVVTLCTRAIDLFEEHRAEAAPLAPPLRRARWYQRRSYAHNELTAYQDAEADVARMARLLGRPVPVSGAGWGWLLARQAFRQVLHRLLPTVFVRGTERPDEGLRLSSLGANTLTSTAYWTAKSAVVFPATALWALNLAERAGMVAPRSCLPTVGFLLGALRMTGAADRYYERARREAQEQGDKDLMAVACLMEGVYGGLFARWELSWRLGRQAIDVAQDLGVVNLIVQAKQAYAFNLALQGRYEDALAVYGEAAALAATNACWKDEFNAQARRVPILVRLGRDSEAEDVLRRARGLVSDTSSLTDRFILASLEGWMACRSGRGAEARQAAGQALEILGPRPSVDPGNLDPLLQVCETLGAAPPDEDDAGRVARLALMKSSLKLAGSIAQSFPTTGPSVGLARGRAARMAGRGASAIRAFRRAHRTAVVLSLDLDAANALRELGACPELPDAERRRHRAAALTVFEERGLLPYVQELREELGLLEAPAASA